MFSKNFNAHLRVGSGRRPVQAPVAPLPEHRKEANLAAWDLRETSEYYAVKSWLIKSKASSPAGL